MSDLPLGSLYMFSIPRGFTDGFVKTLAYVFLTIRFEDTSIPDFLKYAIRYFLLSSRSSGGKYKISLDIFRVIQYNYNREKGAIKWIIHELKV